MRRSERQIEQNDLAFVSTASSSLARNERYAAMKARQLEQADASSGGTLFGIAVTGSPQMNTSETMSAGRLRYMNLKEAQLDK